MVSTTTMTATRASGIGKDVAGNALADAEWCVAELRLLRSGLLATSHEQAASTAARAASLQCRAVELLDEAAKAAEERTGGGGGDTEGGVGSGASGGGGDVPGSGSAEAQEGRAHRLWLRGEAVLGIDDTCPCPDAENLLTRAVKLDPSLVEAWNALGECYWRRGELNLSCHCIRRGLERRRTAQGLRTLSMLLRQPASALTADTASESVALAREALSIDLDSCQSWACLGNAYLGQFAASEQARLDVVKLAQKAYGKAISKEEGDRRPDLHFNRATSCMWAADFEEALNAYDRVHAVDASRRCEGEKDAVYELLRLLHASVNERGGLKPKRLHSLHAQLSSRAEATGTAGALADLDAGRNSTTALWCVVLADIEDSQSPRSGPGIGWKLAVSHDEVFFALCCYGPRLTAMLRPGTATVVSGAILGRVFTNKGNDVFDFPFVQVDGESSIKVTDGMQIQA